MDLVPGNSKLKYMVGKLKVKFTRYKYNYSTRQNGNKNHFLRGTSSQSTQLNTPQKKSIMNIGCHDNLKTPYVKNITHLTM
jgi:hypothetical protein